MRRPPKPAIAIPEWMRWLTTGELRELSEIGEVVRDDGRQHLTPLEQARVAEVTARAEHRMLAGLPTVAELEELYQARIFRAHYDAPRGMCAEAFVYQQLLLEGER
jgi:hypothetical protein